RRGLRRHGPPDVRVGGGERAGPPAAGSRLRPRQLLGRRLQRSPSVLAADIRSPGCHVPQLTNWLRRDRPGRNPDRPGEGSVPPAVLRLRSGDPESAVPRRLLLLVVQRGYGSEHTLPLGGFERYLAERWRCA